MASVRVALGDRGYSIKIGRGLLHSAGRELARVARSSRVAVISQRRVWRLWGERLAASLDQAGLMWSAHLVPDGESAKTLGRVRSLYAEMAAVGIDRSSLIAGFGGGAVGDLAGFVAATWLRGVDFAQIPTTLLAQVDASVGGKTGVNLPAGKNLVGAFWQPRVVLIDSGTLATLPARDYRSGLAEVIKYGIILDAQFYDWMKNEREALVAQDSSAVGVAVRRSCELKADVVRADEREAGLRALLNYGHTIGHAVEAAGGYCRTRHGEAVAIGMVLEARLAVMLGLISQAEAQDIRQALASFGLPVEVPRLFDVDVMLTATGLDKKTRGGRLHCVLPVSIGRAETRAGVTPEMIRRVITESQANAGQR